MKTSTQFSQIMEMLGQRRGDTLGATFHYNEDKMESASTLILQAPSDIGVSRNGGRRGAKFAPQAILAPLSKMNAHQHAKETIIILDVIKEEDEINNFAQAQEIEARRIAQLISDFKGSTIIHLGGGHDHVFPLLASMYRQGRKIKVLNIDAHMDTRIDALPHSGTPFRQFSQLAGADFELIQLGLHHFANSPSTRSPLAQSEMHCIDFPQLRNDTWGFTRSVQEILEYHFSLKSLAKQSDEVWVLSLDCDALEAGIMEGVSAVNHQGIPLHTIAEIFNYFKQHAPRLIAGIYEYNPVYDNLSQKGARTLASLLYPIL